MKNLALSNIHKTLGAKMVSFAGYNMPIQYEGVVSEHLAVREGVGVFDVSHMGEFLISGPQALTLIQKVTSNDASKLNIGKAQYSYLPNDKGGIVDDLIVYQIKEEQYLLVVNGANIQKDWDWINAHNTMKAEIKNISDDYSLLAIQGPKSTAALQPLTSIRLDDIPFYQFVVGDFAGIPHVIISATGYTGSGGFEIYCKNSEAEQIWNAIFKSGEPQGIRPVGLAARDTLRLEMGYCLYGNDIDEMTSPISARLGWVTRYTKNFINSEAIQRQSKEGVSTKLVGFVLEERGIPRKDYKIFSSENQCIGRVTSGTMSPCLKQGIGMGYVSSDFTKIGTQITIEIRNKKIVARVVKIPFYRS